MSTITLAGPEHISRLLPMVAAAHEQRGLNSTDSRRRAALEPLLRGTPLGAAWLIGPKMSPVGFVAVGFGWSIETGGAEASIDELYIREQVRGRGMGSQALDSLAAELLRRGVTAIHIEAPVGDTRAQNFVARRGFLRREGRLTLTRRL